MMQVAGLSQNNIHSLDMNTRPQSGYHNAQRSNNCSGTLLYFF